MIQYRTYPVYIVYSRNKQRSVFDVAYDYLREGDDNLYANIAVKGMSRLEITDDDPAHSAEIVRFENTIRVYLDKIVATEVGRCLLNHLNRSEKLYIIPDPFLKKVGKKKVAQTKWSDTRNEGGGLRMRINPEDWAGYLDDLLAHELTHAVRFTNNRISPKMLLHAGNFSGDPVEEFMATQVANLYRSAIGKKQFHASYASDANGEPILQDKGTIYGDFVQYPELIMALKFCRDNEPLISKLAKLPLQHPEFNPFRDAAVLERMAIAKFGVRGMTQFMPL